jgi:hypothetical protein
VGAGVITALLFQWLPPIPFYLGIPLCIVTFVLLAKAVGLVRRDDLLLLRTALRQGSAASTPPTAEGGADRSPAS